MNLEHIRNYTYPNTPTYVVERYFKAAKECNSVQVKQLLNNVVVVDCETTGVSFQKDTLIQIAAAKVMDGEIVDWFITFINPCVPLKKEIIELTKITDEMLKDAPSCEEAVDDFVNFVGDCTLIAHNSDFDKHFLTTPTSGYPLFNNKWFDSLELCRICFPRLKSHRLRDLIEAFGGPKPTHRADDDVKATVYLYKLIVANIWEMPNDLLNRIVNLASREEWELNTLFSEVLEAKIRANNINVSRETFQLKKLVDKGKTQSRANNVDETRDKEENNDENKDNSLVLPSDEEIINAFSEGGCISKIFDDYEVRQEQIDMALAIKENFKRFGNLVVEAETGVGKSLAYLYVVSRIAQLNDIKIGVATKTNVLLDQLVNKDIPSLNNVLESPVKYVSLKGFSHYPCLRKIDKLVKQGGITKKWNNNLINTSSALATVLSFLEQTVVEDIDFLKVDFRAIKIDEITSSSKECYKKKCPYWKKGCFACKAKEKAEESQIILTNHTLLLSDVSCGGVILPPVNHWIIDEAHNFENEARRTLSVSFSEFDLKEIVERCLNTQEKTYIFRRISDNFNNKENSALFYSLLSICERYAEKLAEVSVNLAIALRKLGFIDPTPKSSFETERFWISKDIKQGNEFQQYFEIAETFIDAACDCINSNNNLIAFLDNFKEMAFYQADLAHLTIDIKETHDAIKQLCSESQENLFSVLSISRRTKKIPYSLSSEYLDIGKSLNKHFYSRLDSCVFCSATLRTKNTFEAFEKAIGLSSGTEIFEIQDSEVEGEKYVDDIQMSAFSRVLERRINKPTFELTLKSPFNYDKNMTIYIPRDIPEPGQPGKKNNEEYLEGLENMITESIVALGGSMLVLFTSRSDMERCFAVCEEELEKHSLKSICQSKSISTKSIIDEFKENEQVSLFALKSFWEGFDAPGDTLRGVIIVKLPFNKPNDPLYKEQEHQYKDKNVFLEYCVPKVILETRQAIGRLIRSKNDKGIVILADSRILKKSYGRAVLESMPTEDVRVMPVGDIVSSIENL